ncbi:hypothetical protein CTEN210_02623 [Chaetoceros tenuissimus]|uniref:Cytochrome P450 n=1 Tax=Chaetoceros tenuissimus TaxID=426638 RepID=A0AAD3CI96_9STRA|nr:hypothetical protein CTEN210_02623 [Chaetoceros tenuissimus]
MKSPLKKRKTAMIIAKLQGKEIDAAEKIVANYTRKLEAESGTVKSVEDEPIEKEPMVAKDSQKSLESFDKIQVKRVGKIDDLEPIQNRQLFLAIYSIAIFTIHNLDTQANMIKYITEVHDTCKAFLVSNDLSGSPMANAYIALALLTLAMSLLRSKKNKHASTPWNKVPGGLPIIGHIPHVPSILDTLEGWADTYDNGSGIVEVHMAGRKRFIICNQEKAELIESKRPYKVIRDTKFSKVLSSLQICGLIEAEGETWKKERRMIPPYFNHKNVQDYAGYANLVFSRLIKKWSSQCDAGPVTVTQDIYCAASDIISLSMLGYDLDSVTAPSEIATVLDTIARLIVNRTTSPFPYWKIPIVGQYIDNGGPIAEKAVAFCKQVLAESASSLQSANNFLAAKMLKEMGKNADQFPEERLVGNLLTMFIAGTETTATTTVSCMYQLAKDKALQEELRAEIEALEEDIESIEVASIPSKLPLMTSFIFEVLRCFPAVSLQQFEILIPLCLDDVEIPAQSSFFIMNRFISKKSNTPLGPLNSPRDKFCAKRYLTQNENGKYVLSGSGDIPTPSMGFRSFGSGARICPGRHLSMMEISLVLTKILRTFEVSLKDGQEEMKHVIKSVLAFEEDLEVVLKPRVSKANE